jgi:hypothetical protein
VGLLNLGWLVLLWKTGTRASESAEVRAPNGIARRLLPFVLANIALWVVVMFGPVLHHGPYAAYLLLFAVLAHALAGLTKPWYVLLLLIQAMWQRSATRIPTGQLERLNFRKFFGRLSSEIQVVFQLVG